MSSSLKYKKIYIDTKYMTPDSNSTSDFKIELPETMYFDNNSSVFYIDDVCIPHNWYSVTENINDKLYLLVGTENGALSYSYIITLSYGNYTASDLVVEIANKINAATVNIAQSLFLCTYTLKTNNIEIKMNPNATVPNGFGFYILTPGDLKTRLGGRFSLPYDVNKPNDCNEVIGNYFVDNDFHPFSGGPGEKVELTYSPSGTYIYIQAH